MDFTNESLYLGGVNLFLLNIYNGKGAASPGLQLFFAGILLHIPGNSRRKNLFHLSNRNEYHCSFSLWSNTLLIITFCRNFWSCWTLVIISKYFPWRLPLGLVIFQFPKNVWVFILDDPMISIFQFYVRTILNVFIWSCVSLKRDEEVAELFCIMTLRCVWERLIKSKSTSSTS